MKVSVLISSLAVSLLSVAPVHAQDSEVLHECVRSFIASNFDGQAVEVRLENEQTFPRPLILRNYSPKVKLVAASKESGRVLASATCSSKGGVVIVEDLQSAQIAAR